MDKPDFVEIGIAADGRVSQVLAINHTGEDDALRSLVKGRINIADHSFNICVCASLSNRRTVGLLCRLAKTAAVNGQNHKTVILELLCKIVPRVAIALPLMQKQQRRRVRFICPK